MIASFPMLTFFSKKKMLSFLKQKCAFDFVVEDWTSRKAYQGPKLQDVIFNNVENK